MNRTRTRVNLPVPLLARSALFSGAYPTLDSVRRENSRRMLRFGITSGSICVDTQPCGVPTRLEYRNSAMFKVPGPIRASADWNSACWTRRLYSRGRQVTCQPVCNTASQGIEFWRGHVTRSRELDIKITVNSPWPGTHDQHPIGEQNRFLN